MLFFLKNSIKRAPGSCENGNIPKGPVFAFHCNCINNFHPTNLSPFSVIKLTDIVSWLSLQFRSWPASKIFQRWTKWLHINLPIVSFHVRRDLKSGELDELLIKKYKRIKFKLLDWLKAKTCKPNFVISAFFRFFIIF